MDGAEEGGGSSMSAFVCTDCKDRQTCGLREKNLQQDSDFIPLSEACTNCFRDVKAVGGRCSNCNVMSSTCCQEGCTHQRRVGEHCITHAALKCASGNCTNLRPNRTSNFCRSCQVGGICSADGCNNKARLATGYCGSKHCPRITGELGPRMNAKPDDQCTNVGCTRKRKARMSICLGCYKGTCSVEGCPSQATTKGGKCNRHKNGTCQAPGCLFVARPSNNGFCNSKRCPRHEKDGENRDAAKKMVSSKKKRIDDSSESDGDDDGSESEDSVVEIAAVAAAASRGRSSRAAKKKASSKMMSMLDDSSESDDDDDDRDKKQKATRKKKVPFAAVAKKKPVLEDSSESDDDDDHLGKKPKAGGKKKKPSAVAKKKPVLGLHTLVKTSASAKRKMDAAGNKSKSKKQKKKEVKDHCVDCKTGCTIHQCACRRAGRKCNERCKCNEACCNQPKKKGTITGFLGPSKPKSST